MSNKKTYLSRGLRAWRSKPYAPWSSIVSDKGKSRNQDFDVGVVGDITLHIAGMWGEKKNMEAEIVQSDLIQWRNAVLLCEL